jgi:hypothetical protein
MIYIYIQNKIIIIIYKINYKLFQILIRSIIFINIILLKNIHKYIGRSKSHPSLSLLGFHHYYYLELLFLTNNKLKILFKA